MARTKVAAKAKDDGVVVGSVHSKANDGRGSRAQPMDGAALRSIVHAAANEMLLKLAAQLNIRLGPAVRIVGSKYVIVTTDQVNQKPPKDDGGDDLDYGFFAVCPDENGNLWTGPFAETEREAWTDASVWVSQSAYRDFSKCDVGYRGKGE